LQDYKNQRRTTPTVALKDIDKLRNESKMDSQQLELLDELENHIKTNFPSHGTK